MCLTETIASARLIALVLNVRFFVSSCSYAPPVDDFVVDRITLPVAAKYDLPALETPAELLVLEGAVLLCSGGRTLSVHRGMSADALFCFQRRALIITSISCLYCRCRTGNAVYLTPGSELHVEAAARGATLIRATCCASNNSGRRAKSSK